MQKTQIKCDICGKEQEKDENVMGQIAKGESLVKVTVKGIGTFLKGFTMHLCPRHYLEYYSNTRNWVKRQSTLDEYMDLELTELKPSAISET